MDWLCGRKATVMGLGRHGGGVEAARFLARHGAEVTVTDLAAADELADSLAALADVPIKRYRLGGHAEVDFTSTNLVLVNPAVRLDDPHLALAARAGAELVTDIELLLDLCPAKIIGVTGSNGKSTTSAMIAAILEADGRRTWLGGNIGRSPLPALDSMTADDWIVLELSSFQLAHLRRPEERRKRRMPEIAAVTNCTANHLDWHADFADYRRAKQRLLAWQDAAGVVVLNTLDDEVSQWASIAAGRIATIAADDAIPPLAVRGKHNRINARCAAAAALAAGCGESAIARGLGNYHGLPHRLERVAEVAGRIFYNDSMATTPESVVAALEAAERPTWLLAGGKDKGGDYSALGAAICRKARGACFYGAARERLIEAANRAAGSGEGRLELRETLPEALLWCWAQSKPGDAILLSPACSSHDQFRDYIHRAEVFSAEIARLV
jgi:UDP-N-acetylmuramoylalanine--D-glutamate ligase